MESDEEEDIEYLVQRIKISIQLGLDNMDIDCIDKNTENRLIDLCLQDRIIQNGQYDCNYIENLIERELITACDDIMNRKWKYLGVSMGGEERKRGKNSAFGFLILCLPCFPWFSKIYLFTYFGIETLVLNDSQYHLMRY